MKTTRILNVIHKLGNSIVILMMVFSQFAVGVTRVKAAGSAPTDIALSPGSVAENLPAGTSVGTLTSTDVDEGDTFIYTLVSGEGGGDNDSFTISDDQLLTAASFDYETKSSYSVLIRTTDSGDLYFEKTFTITVTDVNEAPVITEGDSVSVMMNKYGSPIAFNLTLHAADEDLDPLTWSISTDAGKGSAAVSDPNTGNDMVIHYDPDKDYVGSDSFLVQVEDGSGGIDLITVNVLIHDRAFYLKASATDNWVHAYGWPDGTELTLNVGDPATPTFTTTTTAGAAPWDTLSPVTDVIGVFDLSGDPDPVYDLQTGDELTVSGAGHTETYTVPGAMTQVRWSIGLGTGSDPAQIPVEQQVVDDYNIKPGNQNVELLMEVIDNSTAVDTVIQQINDGNAPDIVGPVGWIGANRLKGYWQDLTQLITDSGIDTTQFNQTLYDWYNTDEGQVALPFAAYPSAIYYNPALFDAAGLNYPPATYGTQYLMPDDTTWVDWNWDTVELVSTLLTLDGSGKNATETGFDANDIVQYGFSFGWEGHPNHWGTFWQGGSLLGGTEGAYTASIPAAWQAAWQWVYDGMWGERPYIPNASASGNLNGGNVFASGKIAMLDTPSWYMCCVGDLTSAGGTFQFGAMPTYNGAVGGRVDADAFRILSASAHKTEAFTALSYLVTTGVDKLIIGSSDLPPAFSAVSALLDKKDDFKTSMQAKYDFVTSDSWDVLLDGLDHPDDPSAESWMPHLDEAWNRLQSFADNLSSKWGFNLPVEETILEADLTAIFNGEPLPLHPFIEVDLNGRWLHGRGWELGTEVTVEIDNPEIPGEVNYTETVSVAQAPWNPGDPNDLVANFNWPGIGVHTGDIITMTGAGVPKVLDVPLLSVSNASAETDLVTGTAPADADVAVGLNTNQGQVMRYVTASGDGTWQADFTAVGLQPGDNGYASIFDDDGDQTQYDWRVLRPTIMANPKSRWVQAREWPKDTYMTLTVHHPGGGTDKVYHATMIHAPWNPGDPFDLFAQFDFSDPSDLQAGDELTMAGDNGVTKTYTVSTFMAVTGFDLDANTVSGTAADGARVQVCVDIPNDCISRWTTVAGGGGGWSVGFDQADPPTDPQDDSRYHTLKAGDKGWASEYDENGNQTWADWNIPNPHIEANPIGHWVFAREWPTTTMVTMTIPNCGEPCTLTAEVMHNPDNPGDPNDIRAYFNLWDPAYDLQPGDAINMDAEGFPRISMIVSSLTVDVIDPEHDNIQGTVNIDGRMNVWVNGKGGPSFDASSGSWQANFDFDFQPGDNGGVQVFDANGNLTQVDWRAQRPWIQANVTGNWLHAPEWPFGDGITPVTLTLTIDGVERGQVQVVINNPGDPYNTSGDFDNSSWPAGVVHAGAQIHVVANDAAGTWKDYTVTDLQVTAVDADANTVSGVAAPGARVQVCFNLTNDCIARWATTGNADPEAGGLGHWSVSYSSTSDPQDDPRTYDLNPGDNGWAQESNNDGDQTWFEWNILNPNFWVFIPPNNLNHNPNDGLVTDIQAYEWPDLPVTLRIHRPGTPPESDYINRQASGEPWERGGMHFYFNTEAILVYPQDIVTVSNEPDGGSLTLTHTMTALAVTELNVNTDTVSGTALAGSTVDVSLRDQGIYRTAVTQPGGTWSVDFSDGSGGVQTANLTAGSQFFIIQQNENNPQATEAYAMQFPSFQVRANADRVEGWGWTVGDTVTISIWDDTDIQHAPDYTTTRIVIADPGDPNNTYVDFGLGGGTHDILPGGVVRLSDGVTTMTMTVTDLSFNTAGIDIDTDVVHGVAKPDVRVNVWACDQTGCYNRHATPDINGDWTVDFSQWGSEENELNTFNIINGTWIDSNQPDENGLNTQYGINVSLPTIEVSAFNNWLHARGTWAVGTVTATIYAGENIVFGPIDATFQHNPGNPGDPNDWLADFDLDGFTLQVGQTIHMTQGATTRIYTIAPLSVETIDIGANTISGSATPGARVQGCVNIPDEGCVSRWTTAEAGNWSVNFGSASDPKDDPRTHTLQPGDNGWAAEYNDHGDLTWVDWNAMAILSVSDGGGNPGTSGNCITVDLDNRNAIAVSGAEWWLVYDSTVGITLNSVNVTSRTTGFSTSLVLDTSDPAAVKAHVLLYSVGGATIPPGTGSILELCFDVDASAPRGTTSPLYFTNVKLSDASAHSIPADFSDTGTFTILECLSGDILCDQVVDVFDLQNQINMILHLPQPDENLRPLDWWTRADLNEDNQWDIYDLQLLINIILGRSSPAGASRQARSTGTNQASLEDIQSPPGTTGNLGLLLNNQDLVASGEVLLSYDSTNGLDITGVGITSRTSGFSTAFSKDDSNPAEVKMHILFYNMGGTIAAGSGSILSLNFSLAANASGTTSLHLDLVKLSDSNANKLTVDQLNDGSVTIGAHTQNVPLETGWNLVSFRLHPADTSIATVLASISGQYSLVYAWDAATATWLIYDPNLGPLNDLTALDERMGFWIKMKTAQTLVVSGSVAGNTPISLRNGWNLVGYPSAANGPLPAILHEHGVGSDFSLIYAYHANDGGAAWKLFDRAGNPLLNDLKELAPGWGYWVKASAAHTWTVP